MKRITKGLITILLAGGATFLAVKGILENSRHERTRRNVQLIIDTDSNRVITSEEWAPVYKELGVEPFFNYGVDLEISQLEQYLRNHSQTRRTQ